MLDRRAERDDGVEMTDAQVIALIAGMLEANNELEGNYSTLNFAAAILESAKRMTGERDGQDATS